MKCIFVGDIQHNDNGFVQDVLKDNGYDEIETTGEVDRIDRTINPVLKSQADVVILDLLPLIDEPKEIVEAVQSIQKSRNNKKIIFLAVGKGGKSPVVRELRAVGYVNFVLASTYAEKQKMFDRCLTNYYETNPNLVDKDLDENEMVREVHFIAFAGSQSHIGTTTQALQLTGYLIDCGKKACYVELNDHGFPDDLRRADNYVTKTNDCITYAGIPMYSSLTMQDMMKKDYEYFILDMGPLTTDVFESNIFFDNRVKRVIVAGIKPDEWVYTKHIKENQQLADVEYIISFADETSMERVIGTFERPPLFSGYHPDMFSREGEDLAEGYRRLLSFGENTNQHKEKKEKKGFKPFRRRRS